MNWCEILLSLITGIVSGIMVTAYYRWKDRERDRQIYFSNFRTYIHKLTSIDMFDIDKTSTFFISEEIPPIYSWIHLTKEEDAVIESMYELTSEFSSVICSYIEDKSQLLLQDSSLERQEIDSILLKKYGEKIASIRVSLISSRPKIDSLGNKAFQKILSKDKG